MGTFPVIHSSEPCWSSNDPDQTEDTSVLDVGTAVLDALLAPFDARVLTNYTCILQFLHEANMSSIATTDARRLNEAIKLLIRRFSLAERADVACCGMTVAQAATLDALEEGPMRLSKLGQRLGIAPSTLSRNLDRLVERGLVDRGPDPDDRRAQCAALTAAGRNAATEVHRHETDFAQQVLDHLPDGAVESTLHALDDIIAAIRSATEHCCPGAYDHLFADSGSPSCERN